MKRMFISAVVILIGCPFGQIFTDEGMWLYTNPPFKQLEEKYGFKPSQEWLDHLQKSSIRFGNGGSASFVSPNGLVMTNHHVGVSTLQKMSTLSDKSIFVRKLTSGDLAAVAARVNGLDFCAALRDLQTSPPTSVSSNGIPVAYAVAHPGVRDMDEDDNFFDGDNAVKTVATFGAPGMPASQGYDDQVIATGFAEMAGRLACPTHLSVANAAGHAARAAYDNYLIALAILQYRAFKLDLAHDDLQQAYVNQAWAIWSLVNDSVSATNTAFDIVLAMAGSTIKKLAISIAKTAISLLKASVSAYKLYRSIGKLDGEGGANKKVEESKKNLEEEEEKRVEAEIYATAMLSVVNATTERAMTIDRKGLQAWDE
jgi:hypothetical protein